MIVQRTLKIIKITSRSVDHLATTTRAHLHNTCIDLQISLATSPWRVNNGEHHPPYNGARRPLPLPLSQSHFPSRPKVQPPPSPKPWPIIGNFNLIGTLPHRSIHELSKKYGPLMHLRFGSFPLIVASSVDMARFLKTKDILYVDRPKMASYNYADITWSLYGAYWRQARRICLTKLFSPRGLALMAHIRVDEVHAMVCDIFAVSGPKRVVHLYRDHMSTLSLNVITRMVMGKRLFANGSSKGPVPSMEVFKWMMDELFLLNGVLNIGDWIPWLDWMDLQGYVRRMKKVGKMFDALMEHILDEHSVGEHRRREGEAARNMVDVLMDIADDPSLEVSLGRIGVKAFTQDLIAGGTESSAATI